MLGAGAVLRAPDGSRQPQAPMRELAEGTDRYGAEVTVTSTGLWQFQVEAWGDPIARWQHDAAIKIPLGQDVELHARRRRGAVRARGEPHQGAPPGPGQPQLPRRRQAARAGQRTAARTAREALEALAARLRDMRRLAGPPGRRDQR